MAKIMILKLLCGTLLLSTSHAAESKGQGLKAWDSDPDGTKSFTTSKPRDPLTWDLTFWKTRNPAWTPATWDENKPTWNELYNTGNDEQRLKAWNNDNSWKNIFTGVKHVTREPVNWNSIVWKLLSWKSAANKYLVGKLSTRHPTARKSTTWRPAIRKTTTWRPPTRRTTTWRPPTRRTTTWRPPTWNPPTKKPPTWKPPTGKSTTRKPSTRRPSNWNGNNTSGSDWNTFIIISSIVVFVIIAVLLFALVRRGVFSSCSIRNTSSSNSLVSR